MSYIGTFAKCLFGRNPGDDQSARSQGGANGQRLQEQITATTSRVIAGPRNSPSNMSFHIQVGAGAAPVGTLTIWYSNLPNPDPASDADWVDSGIASLDLSAVANTFRLIVDAYPAHVRLKVTRTSGTISLNVWARVAGVED
jgi:hypothetical protein